MNIVINLKKGKKKAIFTFLAFKITLWFEVLQYNIGQLSYI